MAPKKVEETYAPNKQQTQISRENLQLLKLQSCLTNGTTHNLNHIGCGTLHRHQRKIYGRRLEHKFFPKYLIAHIAVTEQVYYFFMLENFPALMITGVHAFESKRTQFGFSIFYYPLEAYRHNFCSLRDFIVDNFFEKKTILSHGFYICNFNRDH